MINVTGLIGIILFYLIIVLIGVWASRKQNSGNNAEEEIMLAGRNIGLVVGIFTMTATWVGGGYINGTAEAVYSSGLVWCQAPFGYALSLVLGGIFFAGPMRKQGYVTMIDPLQKVLGERMGGLLFLPALCGEIFWTAGILAALGATLSVVVDMDQTTTIIASACIAVLYTLIGGLYSVAYTDVIQLICIFIGLCICIPYASTHTNVGSMTLTSGMDWVDSIDWWGSIKTRDIWHYIDYGLLLIFGGIPWQVYFQRVLSCKTPGRAKILSFAAAVGCIILATPAMIIGGIGKATNWNETIPEDAKVEFKSSMILPMVLQYLTPPHIAFFGLGAVSAAVMSSADSSILSASSMFSRNIYRLIFRQKASESEVIWVLRISIIAVGALASMMAISVSSVYGLWAMCSDLVYVILFPQLLMVVHFKKYCNTYGSLAGYIVALVLRISGGEKTLRIPALVHYPGYDEQEDKQMFPFRTLAMVSSLITLIVVSYFAKLLFSKGYLKPSANVMHVCVDDSEANDEPNALIKPKLETLDMFSVTKR